jgi:uncharacterized FAD-dependent dehydrogenase
MKYDVLIVGAGPTGIFAAYELISKNPDLKVMVLDKGHEITRRNCPILEGRIEKCPPPAGKKDYAGCLPACSITSGFGGAGAYSDGKFNITSEFGGWMSEYLPPSQVLDLIKYVDTINLEMGAPLEKTNPNSSYINEIEKKAISAGLKLLKAEVRHLGTELNLEILKRIYDSLKDRVEFRFKTEVIDIEFQDNKVQSVVTNKGEVLHAETFIICPGRDGSIWLKNLLSKQKVKFTNNQVDIGVRVETSDVIMSDINKHLYEAKFIYNTSFGTRVRTFCSNPSGHVVVENHSGTMLANGHSYKDPALASANTNFALLVSHVFTEPFNLTNEYAHEIARLANHLSNGGLIIQKFGDIMKNRRSTDKRIKESFVEPTLKEAVPGDLGLALPYVTMKSLIEMIEALDVVTPGIASEHTLLYGVEAKFYSSRPQVDKTFKTSINNLYVGGDGAGLTRGLAQASASGIWIARNICENR